jgi:predicted Zn-dependent peptidase
MVPALLLAAGMPVSAAPQVSRTLLPNGLTVLVRQRPGSGILAARLLVRAGAVDEADVPKGTAYLLAHLLLDERAHSQPRSLAFLQDQVGAGLRVQAQQELTDFAMVSMNESLSDSLDLLAAVVRDLRLPSDPVLRRVRMDAAGALDREDDTFGTVRNRVEELLFPSDRGSPATSEQLKEVDGPALERFYKARYLAGNMVLTVVSGLPQAQVLAAAQSAFKRIAQGGHLGIEAERAAKSRSPHPQDLVQRQVPLAAVAVALPTPGAADKDYATAAVLNVVLGGGKASRLFTALREQMGLGYELGSWSPPYVRNAYVMSYVFTSPTGRQPDGTVVSLWNVARGRMVKEFDSLAEGKLTDAEVQRARRFLAGTYELRHQRAAEEAFLLGWWEALGLGYEQDRRFLQQVEAVTKEDVIRVAKESYGGKVVTVVLPSRDSQPELTAPGTQ